MDNEQCPKIVLCEQCHVRGRLGLERETLQLVLKKCYDGNAQRTKGHFIHGLGPAGALARLRPELGRTL